jgi:hypothetical protein
MATDKTTAQDDLAFLRKLMSPDDDGASQRAFGQMYALWGLAFSVPLFLEWARLVGLVALPTWYWPAAAAVMTVVITIASIVSARTSKPVVGVQNRAGTAVFAGVGLANIAVLLALALVANNLKDGRILMLHAVVVFAFQGAAWYTVWAMRKHAWTGLVAAGWFVFAAGLGATIPGPNFVLAASVGLFLLMVAPGWIMVRTAPKAA